MPVPDARRCLVLAAGLLSALAVTATAAHAQSPRGLYSNMRLVVFGGGTEQDIHSPNAWFSTAPLVLNVTGSDTGLPGQYSNGNFTAVVDYGNLHVYGSGAAMSLPGYGDILTFGDWIGGAPRAEYEDRIYVTSPTLPNGTPATLQFTINLAGSYDVNDAAPLSNVNANLYAWAPGWNFDLGPTGVGSVNTSRTVAVGDSFDLQGSLFVTLAANHLGGGTPPYGGSIDCDLVATFPITSLTPGVVLSSNSQTLAVPSAPRTTPFALAGAEPNPARGALAIRFALSTNASATLVLYDLAGRELAREDVGVLGAGSHVVRLASGGALAPGVYLARLSQGGEARTVRVAVIR